MFYLQISLWYILMRFHVLSATVIVVTINVIVPITVLIIIVVLFAAVVDINASILFIYDCGRHGCRHDWNEIDIKIWKQTCQSIMKHGAAVSE